MVTRLGVLLIAAGLVFGQAPDRVDAVARDQGYDAPDLAARLLHAATLELAQVDHRVGRVVAPETVAQRVGHLRVDIAQHRAHRLPGKGREAGWRRCR